MKTRTALFAASTAAMAAALMPPPDVRRRERPKREPVAPAEPSPRSWGVRLASGAWLQYRRQGVMTCRMTKERAGVLMLKHPHSMAMLLPTGVR
jgi:hypothetical protein